jgi:hypothetical protein
VARCWQCQNRLCYQRCSSLSATHSITQTFSPLVYMTTAILPIRYEIENTGATDGSRTMKQICSTVISEGGYEKKVILQVARTATATTVGTTLVPLVSLRLDSSRLDSVVIPDGYNVLPLASSGTTFEIQLVKNATLTSASWTQTTSDNVEYDVSATAMTGGTVVDSVYTQRKQQCVFFCSKQQRLQLCYAVW